MATVVFDFDEVDANFSDSVNGAKLAYGVLEKVYDKKEVEKKVVTEILVKALYFILSFTDFRTNTRSRVKINNEILLF